MVECQEHTLAIIAPSHKEGRELSCKVLSAHSTAKTTKVPQWNPWWSLFHYEVPYANVYPWLRSPNSIGMSLLRCSSLMSTTFHCIIPCITPFLRYSLWLSVPSVVLGNSRIHRYLVVLQCVFFDTR